ncbi:hypothetical protein TWF281_004526 [Arthrobotrys megalospora]
MTNLFIPLEIQFHILSFACEDWLQQSNLRRVCSAWRAYVNTSRGALLARYSEDVQLKCAGYFRSSPLHLHNAVGCYRGFVRLPQSKFAPCRFDRDGLGKIIGVSDEIDLSDFLDDPVLKPTGSADGNVQAFTLIAARAARLRGPPRVPFQLRLADGKVGTYLRGISDCVNEILGRKIPFLDSGCGSCEYKSDDDGDHENTLVARAETDVFTLSSEEPGLKKWKYFTTRLRILKDGDGTQFFFLLVAPQCVCQAPAAHESEPERKPSKG